MAQIIPDRVGEQSQDPMRISPDGQRRTAPPPGLQQRGDSKDGQENVGNENLSMFGKAKNKARKLRDKVKAQYGTHPSEDKEEEEEEEEEEETGDKDQVHEKPDESVEDVRKSFAGLGGLGTANKESEKDKKSTIRDILGKHDDGISKEETKVPDDQLGQKDDMLIDEKENPKEGLSSYKESEQRRGRRGDDIFTTGKEGTGTDVGTPYIPQRAGQTMAGTTAGILGLGKGNKQGEEGGEVKPDAPKFDEAPLGLKEVPKPLEEEFQSLLQKSKDPQSDVGEGNELSFNEKPTEEVQSGDPAVVTKKPTGLMQGLRDSFTSGQGKKDDIVPEEQSREDQDKGMQSEGEQKGSQSYAGKLFAAKGAIATKLGYGGQSTEVKAPVEESKGEDKLQGQESEEKPSEEVESYSSVGTKKDSGLIQGLKNSLTSDNKDDIVMPEEQSRENQYEGKGNEGEEQEGYGAKSGIASKLGFGGLPTEEKPAFEESKGEKEAPFEESKGDDKLQGPKGEEGTAENKEIKKNTLVSKLSPGEDDKALSQVITEAFNSGAKSLLGGFYGGSPKAEVAPKEEVSPKEEVPPSPSSVKDATAEIPPTNNPQNTSSPKGIVGRVTGVMSSFIGKKPKEDADTSPHTQEPPFGEQKEDLTGSSETQTGNQIEGGTK